MKVASQEWMVVLRYIDRQPEALAEDPIFWTNNGLDEMERLEIEYANSILNR